MLKQVIPNQTKPIQTNPIQTNPFHTNRNSAESEQSSAAALTIPLNDGSEYIVLEEDIAEWQKVYPAVLKQKTV